MNGATVANRCIDEGTDSLDALCQCAGTIGNLAEDAQNQVQVSLHALRHLAWS